VIKVGDIVCISKRDTAKLIFSSPTTNPDDDILQRYVHYQDILPESIFIVTQLCVDDFDHEMFRVVGLQDGYVYHCDVKKL
jgi:hypothetical protein